MKRLVFLFGLVGFVGCFLPLAGDVSWFDLRYSEIGWRVYVVLAGYAVPALVGFSRDRLKIADAIGAGAGFGYVLYVFHGNLWNMIFHSAIGGMLMGIAAILGFAASLVAALQSAKPQRA